MKIRLFLFSHLKDAAGFTEKEVELSADSPSPGEVFDALCEEHPALETSRSSVRFAVNQEYVDAGHTLEDGDEVAIMPPVQGG